MSEVLDVVQSIREDTDPLFLARLADQFGVAFTQASFQASGVTLRVFIREYGDTPDEPIYTLTAIDPSTSYNGIPLIYNSLQTAGWSGGGGGYNFSHVPLVSALPLGGTIGNCTYLWEYELQRTGGLSPVWAIFTTPIIPVMSS